MGFENGIQGKNVNESMRAATGAQAVRFQVETAEWVPCRDEFAQTRIPTRKIFPTCQAGA